ncbi:transposase [Xanthomonas translucens]|nr:transposase [Xanthomonas translucens]UII65149.1 transposase [Xanthomonas translucens]
MRWPQGFRCLSCAGRTRSRFKRSAAIYYPCSACHPIVPSGQLGGGWPLVARRRRRLCGR